MHVPADHGGDQKKEEHEGHAERHGTEQGEEKCQDDTEDRYAREILEFNEHGGGSGVSQRNQPWGGGGRDRLFLPRRNGYPLGGFLPSL